MNFTTLDHFSLQEIMTAFNESFAHYFVNLQLNEAQLQQKIESENIRLSFSVGAVKDGKLIGFILNALEDVKGKKIAYNAGTGVVPQERGNYLTVKMLQYAMPLLQQANVQEYQLEVIDQNLQAIKSYMRAGFKIERILNGYKGKLHESAAASHELNWNVVSTKEFTPVQGMACWPFTWQFSDATVKRSNGLHSLLCYRNEILAGYITFNDQSKRIMQVGCEPGGRQQVIPEMLSHLGCILHDEVSIINVDDAATEVNALLSAAGLSCFIKLYEMRLLMAETNADAGMNDERIATQPKPGSSTTAGIQ